MRRVRMLVVMMTCALSLGVVMLPTGIEGSGRPIAGIQGSGLIIKA